MPHAGACIANIDFSHHGSMSNPLVERILTSPLSFVPAKAPESDTQQTPAGCVVLLKAAPKTVKAAPVEVVRPKLMAEALAAYTGQAPARKLEGSRRKNARGPDTRVSDELASTPSPAEKRSGAALEPHAEGQKNSESEYELALEFHEFTDLSFQGFTERSSDLSDEDFELQLLALLLELDADLDADLGAELEQPPRLELKEELKQELEEDLGELVETEKDTSASALPAAERTPPTLPDEPRAKLPPPPPALVAQHYALDELSPDRGLNGLLRITKNWGARYKLRAPLGFLNYGVTCYMNLAIQLMLHLAAVQHYLEEVLEQKHKLPLRLVTHTLAELAARLWESGNRKYVNPKKIIQRLDDINCMMSEWQQEDSHEYFMSLMSRLQEDSTPKGRKLNELVVYDIFGGVLHQEVVCGACSLVSTTKQEFYDLLLGLRRHAGRLSVELSLADFFSAEPIRVGGGSGYLCAKCNTRTAATKKLTIDRAPETLVVHMKRFKFDGTQLAKVKQAVLYSKYLDLLPYSTSRTLPATYQLVSVIVHEGRLLLSGHYVAHCLQPNGTWLTYDDEFINKIDEATALADPGAYCLVYTKLTPKSIKRPHSKDKTKDKKRRRQQ